LGRPWKVDVGKKGATMGERELGGDAQPKAVVGAGVRSEGAGEEVASAGVVATGVTTDAREAAARGTAGAEEAARAEVMA
jgi:hypothetical protein